MSAMVLLIFFVLAKELARRASPFASLLKNEYIIIGMFVCISIFIRCNIPFKIVFNASSDILKIISCRIWAKY